MSCLTTHESRWRFVDDLCSLVEMTTMVKGQDVAQAVKALLLEALEVKTAKG